MIKHFSVLYAGNIELEDVGLDGVAANDRRYPNNRVIQSFRTAELAAELRDELGFCALWMAEHHLDLYVTRTKKEEFGELRERQRGSPGLRMELTKRLGYVDRLRTS